MAAGVLAIDEDAFPPPKVNVKVVLAAIVDGLALRPVDADALAVRVVDAEDAPHVQEN